MRTFQFSDAKSHKFWNIEVKDNTFTVTYGKVGTTGQTQTKTFATPEKAQSEADKLIREKTGKGYAETTPKASLSTAETFEKAIRANPHDEAARRAYADYLTEQNDPRGEFMQVQIALENESLSKAERDALKKKEAELRKKHGEEFLGQMAGLKSATVELRHGWIDSVRFPNLTVAEARALARSSQARFLKQLIVEEVEAEAPVGAEERYIDSFYEPGPDIPSEINPYDGPSLHALCRCPHLENVRVFKLGEGEVGVFIQGEDNPNCHTPGELAYHLVKQMPRIEELYLRAHQVDANKLFVLPMPELRILQLDHSNSYPLDKLAANETLSNLTTLLCHPHAMEYDDEEEGAYIRLAHLRAICRAKHLKNLIHLRLRLTDFGDRGAKEIVESGILKRLKVLDLQGGCLTDDGAITLASCPDLKNLDFLNLSVNAMGSAGTNALRETGVKMEVSHQHDQVPSGEGGDIPEYLFEGDIE